MPRHHPCLAPLPAPLGLRFRALLGLGFVPPPGPGPAPIAPPSPTRCSRHPRHPPHLSPRVAAAPGPWLARTAPYASLFRRMREKAPFLAASARNACFSRSRWQHPRPMHPFPGAIGRFRIHGARVLPPRALFRVEEPEITHGAKMLPAPSGLSAAAACGSAERALRPAARAWPACRMRPSLSSRLCPPRPTPAPTAPTESRPPVEPSAPTRAPPPAAPHPAARVPLRFW